MPSYPYNPQQFGSQPGTRRSVYDVTAPIGEGGIGQVYQARDTKLDRGPGRHSIAIRASVNRQETRFVIHLQST